jgi:hypothetical protein
MLGGVARDEVRRPTGDPSTNHRMVIEVLDDNGPPQVKFTFEIDKKK